MWCENRGVMQEGKSGGRIREWCGNREWCRKWRAVCKLKSSARMDNHKGYQSPSYSLTHYKNTKLIIDKLLTVC